jgi:hypothetical protein
MTVPKGRSASIAKGDQIKTLPNSAATVFWSDGSFTRLAEKTTINVTELASNPQTAMLKVDFSISEGKTWTRLFRYLTDDSFFHERFDGDTKIASVRGTAFEIDTGSGYLYTESHAVEVEDASGKILATVPEGAVVKTSNLKEEIVTQISDAWRTSNVGQDAAAAAELAAQTRAELASKYSQGRKLLEKIRSLFQEVQNIPLTVSFSGNTLSVSLDPDFATKVKDRNAALAELQAAYAQTAVLAEDPTTVRSKEILRDAILQLASGSGKTVLAGDFARHELYDSWSAAATDSGTLVEMREKIAEYVSAGADATSLRSLESSLPVDKINRFNDRMDELKRRGLDSIPEPFFRIPTIDEAANLLRNAPNLR